MYRTMVSNLDFKSMVDLQWKQIQLFMLLIIHSLRLSEITIRFVSECGGCSSFHCMRGNCFFNTCIYKISPSMFEKLYRIGIVCFLCTRMFCPPYCPTVTRWWVGGTRPLINSPSIYWHMSLNRKPCLPLMEVIWLSYRHTWWTLEWLKS